MEKYDVICSEGHKCNPKANNVISGNGVCLTCCGKVWDAFYVVAGNDTVKFGITSGDTRPRLSTHKRDGSPDCLFLRTDLPDGHARNLETAILDALKRAGRAPVRGREYFPADCTDLILDLARAALPETV